MDRCRYMFIAIVVLIAITVDALIFLFVKDRYDQLSLDIKPTSTILLDDNFSTFWCDGLQIDSDQKINSYYFDEMPEILENSDDRFTSHMHDYVQPGGFQILEFKLVSGSNITVSGSSKDDTMFKLWIYDRESDVQDCIAAEIDRKCPKGDVTSISIPGAQNFPTQFFSYKVPSYGTYHVLVKNTDSKSGHLMLDFGIWSNSYDTSTALEVCKDSYRCLFKFPLASSVHMVVTSSHVDTFRLLHVYTSCVDKIEAYCLAFIITPWLVIGVLFALACCTGSGNSIQLKTRMIRNKNSYRNANRRSKGCKRVSFAEAVVIEEGINEYTDDSSKITQTTHLLPKKSISYGCAPFKNVDNLPKVAQDVYHQSEYKAAGSSNPQDDLLPLL